jgi:hypothetical protein
MYNCDGRVAPPIQTTAIIKEVLLLDLIYFHVAPAVM